MKKKWQINQEYEKCVIKVRLRWFGADLVKQLYLSHLSRELNVLYTK